MTLDLADDSPMVGLPWIITFGPNTDEEGWEPIVVGPYERAHALALAEDIVADEDDLMAVVEPLLPFTSTDEIRAAIAGSIAEAEEEDDGDADTDFAEDLEFDEADLELELDNSEADELEDDESGADDEADEHTHVVVPTPEEVKAGMVRIAAKLAAAE